MILLTVSSNYKLLEGLLKGKQITDRIWEPKIYKKVIKCILLSKNEIIHLRLFIPEDPYWTLFFNNIV